MPKANNPKTNDSGLNFEVQLWAAADRTRGEYLRQDVRWEFGMPPVNNANYAWIQHFIHHLSPVGVAAARRKSEPQDAQWWSWSV